MMFPFFSIVVILFVFLATQATAIGSAPAAAAAEVPDLDGRLVDPFEPAPGIRATVLVFVSTDCPISNRYAPELTRVEEEFSRRGVRFWLVYPDASLSARDIRAHARDYGLGMRALRDERHLLVRRARTLVTPEAAVFDTAGQLVYRGRIDDRFVNFGVQRREPTERDLRDALSAVIEGKPVKRLNTPAVGCSVPY